MTYDYDPQKLLPDLRFRPERLWSTGGADWLKPDFDARRWFAIDIDQEYIDFEPRERKEVIYLATPTGRVVEERFQMAPLPSLAPFVKSGKTDAINNMKPVVARWGEADSDPLADIQEFFKRFLLDGEATMVVPLSGDLSKLEAYALASLLHESGDPVTLDLSPSGGSLSGLVHEMFVKQEKPLPDGPSYLKHDPTKRHRRTKR